MSKHPPLRSKETRHAVKAWAVWNSCQGVFPCGVRHTRKEAEALLAGDYAGTGCEVVPVRVVVENDPYDRMHRDMGECDWEERARARPTSRPRKRARKPAGALKPDYPWIS